MAPAKNRTCQLDRCDSAHYAKGWCRLHYEQCKRGKVPTLDRSQYTDETAVCRAPDCDVVFRQRKWGSPRLYCSRRCSARVSMAENRGHGWLPAYKRPGAPPCSVEGCDKPKMSLGLCPMHYERMRKYGEPGLPESKHRPGLWRLDRDGYVHRWFDGHRQMQHRLVMEEVLGRPLYPEENVHHKNGQRADNRPENLELWVTPQPTGQRVDELVAWVVEHYPEQVRAALTH